MVAEISGAALNRAEVVQSVLPMMEQGVFAVRQAQGNVDRAVNAPETDVFNLDQVVGAFSQLQNRQEVLTGSASVVRETQGIADKASQLLDKMAEDLETVVKIFPPYPIDSPERISLLNSFGSMHKLIDELSFPPTEQLTEAVRLLGTEDQSDGSVFKKSDKAFASILDKEPMWAVSELKPDSASDAEISEALGQVKETKQMLEDLKQRLWEDVVGFVEQQVSVVEEKSSEVRSRLAGLVANQGGVGLTSIGRDALQLEHAAESR